METKRFILRDFACHDEEAFLEYQLDPRYRTLYDIPIGDSGFATALFHLFEAWQLERPRVNFQLGIFGRTDGMLYGCGGIRLKTDRPGTAVIGLELAPRFWGRYRIALEVGERLASFAFNDLSIRELIGDTSSGNSRVSKIAEKYGARRVEERTGPPWMTARGWTEVDWVLSRDDWLGRPNLVRKVQHDESR